MTESNRSAFFREFRFWGLTFDDVRTVPAHAEKLPHEVQLASRVSRRVPVPIPFASAAMLDVTEDRLAIAIAEEGGIGFLHRKLTAELQAAMVRRVKSHIHGAEGKPEFVRDTETIAEVAARIEQRRFAFHRFPVVDSNDRVVGILDSSRFEFYPDHALQIREIMGTEFAKAPVGTTIDEAYRMMREGCKRILPLHDGNGRLAGMYIFSDVHRIKSGGPLTHNLDSKGHLRVGAAIGVGDEAIKRLELLAEAGVDVVAIDTSHGDSHGVFDTLRRIKAEHGFDRIDIIAGNVATYDAASSLVQLGADGIKVGIGPGSICTTRTVSGTGIPQVTAVYEATRGVGDADVPVIADGGLRNPGDIVIALAAGAHCVMMGKLFAGCEETPGDVRTLPNGVRVKDYRGMGSPSLLAVTADRYAQQGMSKASLIPEGVEGLEPYKGTLRQVMADYVGGLRIGMGYAGTATIDELRTETSFTRITAAGLAESRPHDILLAQETNPSGKEG